MLEQSCATLTPDSICISTQILTFDCSKSFAQSLDISCVDFVVSIYYTAAGACAR